MIPAAALFESWPGLFADSPPNAVLIEYDASPPSGFRDISLCIDDAG